MALRRRVTPIEDWAETLRRGSVRGSGELPIRSTPAVPQALGPTATEDKASSSPATSGVLNKVSAQHNVQPGRQICHSPIRLSADRRVQLRVAPRARRPKFV